MAVPRFNFIRLLIDLATAHSMPQPIFIPANHPLPGHHAFVCQYNGVDAIGGGETEAAARNTAARQVWIEMGHLITVDPRCVVLYYSIFFSPHVVLVTEFISSVADFIKLVQFVQSHVSFFTTCVYIFRKIHLPVPDQTGIYLAVYCPTFLLSFVHL